MTSADAGRGFVSSVAICCGTLNIFPSAGGKGLRGLSDFAGITS